MFRQNTPTPKRAGKIDFVFNIYTYFVIVEVSVVTHLGKSDLEISNPSEPSLNQK
jgi:hypothetical protein